MKNLLIPMISLVIIFFLYFITLLLLDNYEKLQIKNLKGTNFCYANFKIYKKGEQFMDKCNKCTCFGDGVASCTRMGCIESPYETVANPFIRLFQFISSFFIN